MSTKIYYDGVDIVGTQPVPFFGLSQDMITHGKRHGQRSNISLEGQLTGNNHNSIMNDIESLVLKFSENFKDLKITEEGSDVLTFSNCKVESINFSDSTLSQLVEYSISLSCYNNFSGTFGVLNPKESVSFSENDDGTVNLTHDISAEGFKTGGGTSNAFENAKNYVLNLTGWNPTMSITPAFINGGNDVYPVLISTTESIDRLAATYSVSESYVFETGLNSYRPITNYSVSKETSMEDEVSTVSININGRAGKNLSVDWSTYFGAASNPGGTGVNLYEIATGNSNTTDLLTQPVEFTIEQDDSSNTCSVRATYDNNQLFTGGNVHIDPTVSLETNDVNGITTVSINTNLIARGTYLDKKANIKTFLDGLKSSNGVVDYLHNLANEVYTEIHGNTFPLNAEALSFSESTNDFTNETSISASFDNSDRFTYSGQTYDIGYTISVTPSIKQYHPNPSYNQNGYYIIYDPNIMNREKISFNLELNYSDDATLARDVTARPLNNNQYSPFLNSHFLSLPIANSLLEKLGSGWLADKTTTTLDSETSNVNEHSRTLSVNQSYSQESYNGNDRLIIFGYKPVNTIVS